MENPKIYKRFFKTENPEMTGNYTIFYYGDGWLTAYNEDTKTEYYLTNKDFKATFLSNEKIQ